MIGAVFETKKEIPAYMDDRKDAMNLTVQSCKLLNQNSLPSNSDSGTPEQDVALIAGSPLNERVQQTGRHFFEREPRSFELN